MLKVIFRQNRKYKLLRIISISGLSLIFASILISYGYIKKELSYDKFNSNVDNIVRMSLQINNEPLDGRNYGDFNKILSENFPGIKKILNLIKIDTGILKYKDKTQVVNNFYISNSNFFEVFNIKIIEGEKEKLLSTTKDIVISKSFAKQLFNEESALGKEITFSGRKFPDLTLFVSGVFEDFPEEAHFHPKIIIYGEDIFNYQLSYCYILLKEGTDINTLKQNLTDLFENTYKDSKEKIKLNPVLIPLGDIHLHSNALKELEHNGNIYFIYLIIGANIILLVIVLFNHWLNSNLIFSQNRKYHQLLRLNGASSLKIFKYEMFSAIFIALTSIILGFILRYIGLNYFYFTDNNILQIKEIILLISCFIILIVFVSLLPSILSTSYIIFKNENNDLKIRNISFSNIKYMLIIQYSIVIFIIIITIVINQQISLIKNNQLGGNDNNIIVTSEQPEQVKVNFDLLKTELLKYPEIEFVTAAMQLPGTTSKDATSIKTENNQEVVLPILVIEKDYIPCFNINMIAGESFSQNNISYHDEFKILTNSNEEIKPEIEISEEYIINEMALKVLGFKSPKEAIGKNLYISHVGIGYIKTGKIIGVCENFNHTTVYEDNKPLLVIQRSLFLNNIIVKFDPDNQEKALKIFNDVWSSVNPDFPVDYTFLQNVYNKIYHNEINAALLVRIFSILCLIIINLGLIIFMSFLVKTRSREIAIRKINGARIYDIIKMLNINIILYFLIAFIITIPISYFTMQYWLESFVYKTHLDWWVFILSGIIVLIISVSFVTIQSWKTANTNPYNTIRNI